MEQRRKRLLVGSLMGVAVLCAVIFFWSAKRVSGYSARAVQEIAQNYMASISRQATMRLGAAMEDHPEGIEAAVEAVADILRQEMDAGMIESYAIVRRDGSCVSRSGDAAEGTGPLYVYCGAVPHTDWVLLLSARYAPVNTRIDSLNRVWAGTAMGGCMAALAALLLVFLWYICGTRRQFREMEEARRFAERASRAKSQFLSNMSHDIRTPMNGIVGMTAIASANLDDPVQVEKCLHKIASSSHYLLGLINNILDMAKIDGGVLTLHNQRMSLRELLNELVGIVRQQMKAKSQRFDVYVDGVSVEELYCDSVRLRQIFLNLLSNAIKFTPEGGRIQVRLREEPSSRGEGYVRSCLYVEDNGVGMKPEFLTHIYESFAREDSERVDKAQGAGLGLTITKHIVDAMGGSISIRSQVGRGTVVEVAVDLEKAAVPQRVMYLPNWAVLVVDDSKLLCETAAATLESLGVRADYALTVNQALDLAQSRAAAGAGYDVVLVDWTLGGAETTGCLRELCGEKACILLTSAYGWDDMEEAARQPGIDGQVSKPLFRSTLYEALRQYRGWGDKLSGKAAGSGMDFNGWHVMVAEDNDLNWEIAEKLLSGYGMEPDRAENGKICVERFTASPPGYYDGILMDLRMPEMTGYEAAQAIRAQDRPDAATVPIIAMSADAFTEDIQRCLDAGMNAHSAKPINVKVLTALLGRLHS